VTSSENFHPHPGNCALAASGQVAAAPPRSVMNLRRLMSGMGLSSCPGVTIRNDGRTLLVPLAATHMSGLLTSIQVMQAGLA
jgi:hypothetical protein